jgi:hypothetical protein
MEPRNFSCLLSRKRMFIVGWHWEGFIIRLCVARN